MAELKLEVVEYSKAFPRKVNAGPYMHIIDAAKDAEMGADKMPKVVVQTFDTKELMVKAATAIRRWSTANDRILSVSEDEHTRKIKVYRRLKPFAPRKPRNRPELTPPTTATTSKEGTS